MTATVTTLRTHREQVREELAANDRHPVNVLRDPEPELQSAAVGDVLAWCEGLDDERVTAVLDAAKVNWGRRLSLLSQRDIAAVCWAISTRHPGAWERWKAAQLERRSAA